MAYEVISTAAETIIVDKDSALKIRVTNNDAIAGTAYCLGTLYTENGSFSPAKVYTFQVSGDETIPVEQVKQAAVFFFASLLDTERYILEIPRSSALFAQEAQRIFGDTSYERAV